jgi:hypothetical protein
MYMLVCGLSVSEGGRHGVDLARNMLSVHVSAAQSSMAKQSETVVSLLLGAFAPSVAARLSIAQHQQALCHAHSHFTYTRHRS